MCFDCHALVENSKGQRKQTEETCTHPARARGADEYAASAQAQASHQGCLAKYPRSLSLSLTRLSLPLSFSLLRAYFPLIPRYLLLPHIFTLTIPVFIPAKRKRAKATQIMCVWICSMAWVSNAQWKMYFCILYGWMEIYFSSLKLMFGVSVFDWEKTFWKPFMVYKCTVFWYGGYRPILEIF